MMLLYMKKQKYYIKRIFVLKIISIHIPKTAGRSFYQILKWAYENKIGLPQNKDKFVVDGSFIEDSFDFNKTEVLHDHFYFKNVFNLYQKYNPKIIVWLRNPVDRVISNYYYNVSMNLQKPWKKNANKRKDLSLIEYASKSNNQNSMLKFLDGINLDNIFFIGITERFNEDANKLGKMLHWQEPIPEFFINKGTDYYKNPKIPIQLSSISDKIRRQIRDMNLDDVYLYETITTKQ